ncbi:MAG: hypothetical protein ACRDHM_04300 [Actinomycetota bacterium]
MTEHSSFGALLVIPALVLAFSGSAALATTETHTEHVKNFTESFTEFEPCLGVTLDVTITYNAVFHVTETKNGFHVTGTSAGTFVAVGGGTTYTGHFSNWFGQNDNPNTDNATFTFHVTGKGDDGSRIHFKEVAHVTADEIIDVETGDWVGQKVAFDKLRCG